MALPTNSVFQNDWWLDAVAPGSWRDLEVREGSELIARMPVVTSRRYGLNVVGMPPLTYTLGPWIRQIEQKTRKRNSSLIDICDQLASQIPECDYFIQNFHYSIDHPLAFAWRGFSISTVFTYIIHDLKDYDKVWDGYHSTTRTMIRKAGQVVTIREDLDLKEFWRLLELAFARNAKQPPYDYDTLARLASACKERNAGRITYAVDESGNIHAANFCAWSEHGATYLAGGSDPDLRNSGAASLLMDDAIRHAAQFTDTFDFQGVMHQTFERFKRNFGGSIRAQLQLRRDSRRMRFVRSLGLMKEAVIGA